jgi:hypothetical protein
MLKNTVISIAAGMLGRLPPKHNEWSGSLTTENAVASLRDYNELPWIRENYIVRSGPPYNGSDWFLEPFELVLRKITSEQALELGRYIAGSDLFRANATHSHAVSMRVICDLFELCPDHQTQILLEVLDSNGLLTTMFDSNRYAHESADIYFKRLPASRENTEDTVRYLRYCRSFQAAKPELFSQADQYYPEYKCLF